MSKTEIDALEAGPELDRLVAEACGIGVFPVSEHDPDCFIRYDDTLSHIKRRFNGLSMLRYRPSRDWSDAMFAAEKFAGGKSFHVNFDADYGIDKRTGWDAVFGGVSWSLFAPTGPVAICRAILKAKWH